jgi:DNA-binding transcriptional MocR family regulator
MPSPHVSASHLARLLGDATATSPAYRGLSDAIRLLVADGRVLHGTRLPSERELTVALGVSRTTVTRAYAELRDRGYLTSRRGSRSVVTVPGGPQPGTSGLLSPSDRVDDFIDLTCAAPVAPQGILAAYEAAVQELPRHLCGTGYHPGGLPELRTELAERYTARGVATDPEQIIVTGGALAGSAVAARALVGAGDRVVAESPGYPNVLATFRRAGARLTGVPVAPTGNDVAVFSDAVRQVSATAALLVPDFHNPTGTLMPDEDRARIAHALRRSGAVPVVDETLVEVALDPAPPTRPFAAFDGRTITVGSASKSHWGGLRIGWIRVPINEVGRFMEARVTLDLGAPVLEQVVLSHLLRQGSAPVEAQREQLRLQRAALVHALAQELPDWQYALPPGGLALWCTLPEPLSTPLVAAAEREKVLLAPGSAFAVDGRGIERHVRIPYALHPDTLVDAAGRIATAWERAKRQRGRRSTRRPVVA